MRQKAVNFKTNFGFIVDAVRGCIRRKKEAGDAARIVGTELRKEKN